MKTRLNCVLLRFGVISVKFFFCETFHRAFLRNCLISGSHLYRYDIFFCFICIFADLETREARRISKEG